MNKESLFMIKPGEQEIIAEEAVSTAIELGLKVHLLGEKSLTHDEANQLYQLFEKEEWFPDYVDYLTSGDIRVFLTEGDDAIDKTMETKRRIREKHAKNKKENVIHAPKNPAQVQENLELFRRIL